VQNGGGMSLLADRLGYVRLAEPVRFHAAWERAASLGLRDGDATVAEAYERHGRINGGKALQTRASAQCPACRPVPPHPGAAPGAGRLGCATGQLRWAGIQSGSCRRARLATPGQHLHRSAGGSTRA
jgi:hypothetical protein